MRSARHDRTPRRESASARFVAVHGTIYDQVAGRGDAAADLLRLRHLIENAPRFLAGSEPGLLWRGALVDTNVARKKRTQSIAMPCVFSYSRSRVVAIDWAMHHKEEYEQPRDLVWAVFCVVVPPETPALRISQSAIIYEHHHFLYHQDALMRQREVMLPPGELTDVAWKKTWGCYMYATIRFYFAKTVVKIRRCFLYLQKNNKNV